MVKKNLKIESSSFTGNQESDISAHDMLLKIHEMLTPSQTLPHRTKRISLKNALSRVVAEEIRSQYDSPLFDESLRDGFAVANGVLVGDGDQITLDLVGETGAGDQLNVFLESHEAWKVMTGGVVPDNCARVIPQEWCTVAGSKITISARRLSGPRFIKRKGCDFKKNDLIACVGDVISPASISKIADCGWSDVNVYRRPRVCFCCTGKELVEGDRTLESGQKISSNQYLLSALLEKHGCLTHDYGIVADDVQAVNDFFQFSLQDRFDLVVTTGGTGGGAYDLVESGFVEAGGTLLCNSIDMRPGKSLIVGKKDGTLYVGLPGPPHAVHTVFLEVVVPLLGAFKGVKENVPPQIVAIATEKIVTKTRGALLIKEGIFTLKDGSCQARTAGKNEYSNCNLLIGPGRDVISIGERVDVHLYN